MSQTQSKRPSRLRRATPLFLGLILAWIATGIAMRAVLLERYADYHAKVRAFASTDKEAQTSADVELNRKFAEAYEDLQASNILTAAYFAWRLTIYT